MDQTQIGSAVDSAVRRAWWSLFIRGLLALAVGILIIARPMESVAAFALVIALWALMHGIVTIVHSFDLRPIARYWWLMLLGGIISAGFGAAALYYYPGLSLTFAVVWASWWLMLGGVAGISIAVQERRAGVSWGWTMALGILGVVAAIAAFASPPATLGALMGLLAAFAIIAGLLLLVGAYRLRNAADEVATAVHRAAAA